MSISSGKNTFAPLSIDIYGDEWFTEQGTADEGAQSRASGGRIHVDCHASRLRAHVCQRTGIRGRASSRGATLDVCPYRGIRVYA
ncbi:MAG: hypothetical protein V1854_01650, partial [Methanobacteriota archaeon]